jgi:hypothetical protein
MTTPVWAGGGVRSTGIKTPRVNYIVPKNDSEIDLTGKNYLTFRWKPTPRPQGGRRAYKFTLYKGFKYDVAFGAEVLRHDTYSIDIPCSKLENGIIYTWKVEQRAAHGGWSADLRWSFKVKK